VVAGRLFYKGGAAATPTSASINTWKDDFLLGSLYQNGFDGTGTRASEFCDNQVKTVATGATYAFKSKSLTH
jgi:hypothetical protein